MMDSQAEIKSINRIWFILPLAAFFVLAFFFGKGFELEDPNKLPSAMLGKPFPNFSLPNLKAPNQQLNRDDMLGKIALVTVWATWCPTCKSEHGELSRLVREEGLTLYGINYKDDANAAIAFLDRFGDPFEFNIIDREGRLGIDLGVYGAPESFLIDADGQIRYKRVGDINPRIWEAEIRPMVEKLRREAGELADGSPTQSANH